MALGLIGSEYQNDNTIVALVTLMFNQAPGSSLLANYRAYTAANGLEATSAAFAAQMNVTNEAWGAAVIANLGLTGLAATTAQAYFDENFAAGKTQGEIGLAAAVWLQTPSLGLSDSTFKSFAETFTANVASGVTYSQDAANTAPASTSNTSVTTFTLTTGTDAKTGTAGNDTFNGVLQGAGATGTTAAPGDVVNGGAGSDTLNIAVAGDAGGAYTLTALQTESVEKVTLSNFDTNAAATTVATGLMTGLETVGLSSSGANGDTVFSGMQTSVAAQMANGSADLTLTYDGAKKLSGEADSQTLNVSNVTGGTFTANGAETINVVTSTAKSTLTNIAATDLKTITVSGDQDLKISTALTNKTFDASAATGGVTVTLGTADQTVTGGAGNDVIDAAATLTSADTIAGGEGSDTLKLSAAGTIDVGTSTSKGELYNVSGFETIDMASTNDAATLNLKDTSGVETVVAAANVKTIDVDNAVNSTAVTFVLNGTTYTTAATDGTADVDEVGVLIAGVINALDGFSATTTAVDATTDGVVITSLTGEAVEIGTFAGGTTTVVVGAYNDLSVSNMTDQAVDVYSADKVTARLADGSGDEDAMSVNLKTLTADKDFAQTIGDIDVANVETLSLSSSGMKTGVAKTLSALSGDASLTTLNITGDSDLVITDHGSDNSKLATINAADFTGDLTISDSVASLAQSMTTGSGNDSITFDSGEFTAEDSVDMGGNTNEADGTAGKDTLNVSGAIGSVVKSAAVSVANVENFNIAAAGNSTYIDATSVTDVDAINTSRTSGTTKITNLAAGTEIGLGIADVEFAGTADIALADATGAADELTFNYADTVNATVSATLKTAGVETVTISATKTTNATGDDQTVVATDLTASTIKVTDGTAAGTLGMGTLNKATTTFDASAYKGGVTFAGATGVAMNVTSDAAAADSITTSTGADTVTLTGKMGTAAHTVATGTGEDVLNITANGATNLTNVSGVETLNITVSDESTASFATAADAGLVGATTINISGGNSLSKLTTAGFDDGATAQTIDATAFNGTVELTLAADALDAELSIKGGASTKDKVSMVVAGVDNKPKLMSGIETLALSSTNSDVATLVDLTNVTGLSKLTATYVNAANADEIEVAKLATGVAVEVATTETGDILGIGMADAAAADTTLAIELKSATAAGDVLDLNAAGVENLTIKNSSTTAMDVDLAGVDGTDDAAVTVTITGTGSTTLNAINTDITTIAAAEATGSVVIAAAERDADALNVTTGTADDTIAMENVADVLNAGLGTDKLVVNYGAVLGGIQIDFGAADQITSIEGQANAAVQTGFENIDLSSYTGFGAVVTGSDSTTVGDEVTGTASVDRFSMGKGNDTINVTSTAASASDVMDGGAGDDTLVVAATTNFADVDGNIVNIENITLSAGNLDLTGQSDGFVITAAVTGANTIVGSSGVDKFVSSATSSLGSTAAGETAAGGGIDTITVSNLDKFKFAADAELNANDAGAAVAVTLNDGADDSTMADLLTAIDAAIDATADNKDVFYIFVTDNGAGGDDSLGGGYLLYLTDNTASSDDTLIKVVGTGVDANSTIAVSGGEVIFTV
jgi:hypothetical protein